MVLKEFATSMPLLSIIVFSFFITLFFLFIYKIFTNQDELKNLREKTKELQEKIKAEKDPNKAMILQKEMLQLSAQQMKHNLKPMLITYIPSLLIIFVWLRGLYTDVGNIIYWKVDLPLFHDGAGWLLSYIIFSIVFNTILRKAMKVY